MKVDRDGLRILASVLLVGIPCIFGGVQLSEQFQRAHCPPDTIIFGSSESGMAVLGMLGVCAALSFLVARLIKTCVPWFQNKDDEWNGNLVPTYVYLIVFAATMGLWVLGTRSYFCATDSSIVYDDVANSISRNYGWGDVAAVHTSCYWHTGRNTSGWRQTLEVIMTDGTRIDLMGNESDMPEIYPRIAAALDGRAFSFSTSIDPKCEYSHMEMLTQRP